MCTTEIALVYSQAGNCLKLSRELLRQSEEKPSIAAMPGNFFHNNMAARGELDYCADEGTDEGWNEGAEGGGDLGREGRGRI